MDKLKNIQNKISGVISPIFKGLYRQKDKFWTLVWVSGLLLMWLWDVLYLNAPALERLLTAFFYTFAASLMVIVFTAALAWGIGVGLYFLDSGGYRRSYIALTFFLNIIRSIPQIIGILFGYIILTFLIVSGTLTSTFTQLMFIAFTISLFVFLEVADLIRSRIAYYEKLDFFPAMLACGIKKSRIVNIEILYKNSLSHLFHKLISIFGITIFLLCSIDFVISVGLSTRVSLSNFPVTLGNLLAKLDSKQDILAISTLFTNPGYISELFTTHLQGISVAFIIVFSLLSIYMIANGFIKRKNLYTRQ